MELATLAVEVIPVCALRAIFGVGLKEATNWSSRAANKRTTLLLVWDQEEKKETTGIPKYRGKRGRKQRKRETVPGNSTPPPPPKNSEEPAPAPPEKEETVPGGEMIRALTDRIALLSDQITAVFYPGTENAATSPISEEQVRSPTPHPPPLHHQDRLLTWTRNWRTPPRRLNGTPLLRQYA
ncbi:hypothetical protein ACJMK2_025559 [Sinanodonta woodiana]|uniref:Uncharacterized protein n=1 Tax=Sinanodonta woodiana TaxID=1069815 RepID=A0ABD3XIU3_SINWO